MFNNSTDKELWAAYQLAARTFSGQIFVKTNPADIPLVEDLHSQMRLKCIATHWAVSALDACYIRRTKDPTIPFVTGELYEAAAFALESAHMDFIQPSENDADELDHVASLVMQVPTFLSRACLRYYVASGKSDIFSNNIPALAQYALATREHDELYTVDARSTRESILSKHRKLYASYKTAAENGSALSMFKVAELSMFGFGVHESRSDALTWARLAFNCLKDDHPQAVSELMDFISVISTPSTPEEMKEIRMRAMMPRRAVHGTVLRSSGIECPIIERQAILPHRKSRFISPLFF